ncbi:MAG: addiction module toxin, HicA family [Bacteroidetes bacterium]|nr:addiction module toxin, HicA family [Bacteroidota bacterium]
MKVRDVVKKLRNDGWVLVRICGSLHQYKHPVKGGVVTTAGKPGDELAVGTSRSTLK